ncbi:MAG TPA: CHASE domain-containing protein [Phycisphaerae bacterium]|nr:CHASE domain-containing protein [Phycisphaerae bacterium]
MWPSYLVLGLSLVLCVVSYLYVDATVSADEGRRFDQAVKTLKQTLSGETDRYTDLLQFTRAFVDGTGKVTRESWRRFTAGADLTAHPGLLGLGYAERVSNEQLPGYVAEARKEGYGDYAIRPPGDRAEYFPVNIVEPPTERNRVSMGFDLMTDPVRSSAMREAELEGRPAATSKLVLLPDVGKEEHPGFLVFVPVYRLEADGSGPHTAQERQAALRGFVYAPFQVDSLVEGLRSQLRDVGVVEFQIYDGQQIRESALLYDSREAAARGAGTKRGPAPGGWAAEERPALADQPSAERVELRVEGRPWTLVAVPSPELLQTVDHHLPWLVLTGGALLSWLLFGVSWMQMRARLSREAAAERVAESERRLRASELRYRMKIEQSPLAVQTLSPEGRTTLVNKSWEDLWGITFEQLGEYNVLEDGELVKKGVMPLIKRAFAGETVTIGPIFYDAGELATGAHPRSRWVRSVLYPVKDPTTGEITELVLMHEDFTLRKEAEAELREAKEAAEAANRAKDQFLAVLSHELRNPLSPVLSMVDLLSQGELSAEKAAEAMEVIRRNVELEARLIDDLLDVTRISRGKLHLDMEVVDVHQALEHAVQICAGDAAGKGVRVEKYFDAKEHAVRGDPARLQQVFWNLIKNAVKFTPPGGTIFIRTGNRGRGDGDGAERIAIEVADTGIGVAAEKLPRIFEAFEQADGSITRRFGGLGLGLAITRALVGAHGGRIEANSPGAGQGTTFTVSLPVVKAEAGSAAAAAAGPGGVGAGGAGGAGASGSGRKVDGKRTWRLLVVEDQPDARRGMQMLLEREGYEVRAAATGGEALELARDWPFDLLVSDIGLPDLSGLELLPRLRALRPAPAIALTGFGMEQDIQRAVEAGFDVHITKPVSFERLRESIGELLGRG